MSRSLQALFTAILDDDRALVQSALQADPELASGVAAQDSLQTKIVHWIYTGDTPLHAAAAGYRVEIAAMLLAAGADAGAGRNRRWSQPLHYAADGHLKSTAWNPERQVAMIRLLLDAGASIDARDKNGATPLHRAVRTRCAAAVAFLLSAGADPAIRNKPGSTPFHLAVQNTGRGGSGGDAARSAQRDIILAFLKRGVSPALPDARGKSVSDWGRSPWIQEMLAANGR